MKHRSSTALRQKLIKTGTKGVRQAKYVTFQMAAMRAYATVGAKTVCSLIDRIPDVGFLSMAADITHYHDEWVDGTGYPKCLAGEVIPPAARITLLADVYDALTTQRIYKDAFSDEKARRIIIEGSGTPFDPTVVDACWAREDEFCHLATVMADQGVHQPRPSAAASVGAGEVAHERSPDRSGRGWG